MTEKSQQTPHILTSWASYRVSIVRIGEKIDRVNTAPANEWVHPKYVCRICNYLFCIHAKFYKHISPSYFKPDAKSLKFCWRCSYWIIHSSVFKDSTNFRYTELTHYWSYRYNSFSILLWILLMWKPSKILMIFELFLDQILWRARNNWKFLTFYLKCAISRKILEGSKIWMTVFW